VAGPHGDLYGHGTACAGIIRSLAPGVELWSVRVLGERLTGKGWVFAAGLEWCIENGMDVVNLSLSTSSDDYFGVFHELVDQAVHAGIALVSAMANERKATYPSEFSGVLSVATVEEKDPERFWRNPGPPAEWGAAGVDVEVAWLGGATMEVTGNSFAAPVIAGHAARVLGAHPGLAPWQVKSVLAALAENAEP
jgi:subtilisin family serine protease